MTPDRPNLVILDVVGWGYRLTVTMSSVSMRPLLAISLWRCPGRFWWRCWERVGESGH